VKRSEPTIVTMGPGDEDRILEVCELLVRSFRDLSPTWVPTVEAARAKVVGASEPSVVREPNLHARDRVERFDRTTGSVQIMRHAPAFFERGHILVFEVRRSIVTAS
jgi:hypothetical protein